MRLSSEPILNDMVLTAIAAMLEADTKGGATVEDRIVGDRPRYTYTSELLSKMTDRSLGIRRRAANWTAYGSEAVVAFGSSEDEQPQLYKVVITPLDRYDEGKEAALVDDLIREYAHPERERDRSQENEEVAIWNAR